MDIKTFIEQVLYIVATCILPILTIFITKYLRTKVSEISESIENERLQNYALAAYNSIEKAVVSVSQTYVDTLKVNGAFTKEAQEQAKQMALQKAKEMITEESKEAIEILYNDFDAYLEASIEAIVRDTKIIVEE